jgi:tyrosyl-tRNA synthetase
MSDMTLSEELQWRGLIKDHTFADLEWLNTPRTFYLGSDGSADSLTIGNLAIYMLARHLAAHGWKAVMLVGGATSLIGDPGGKDEERQLKSEEEIARNVSSVAAQIKRIFAGNEFEMVNNYDWFKHIGYLEFLRDVGKHYSMTELIQRDFIASRMGEGGSGISYAEFSYSLIQGYDYWWLFKHKGVEMQIGGSDQWGNMLSGAPLIRKKEGKEVHALSMPLVINKATGKKFGKRTSPYKFYQFWLNVDDEGVEDYLKIYTELDRPKIDQVMHDFNKHRASRIAQKTLAYEVTKLIHGEAQADMQVRIAEAVTGQDAGSLQPGEVETLRQEMPYVKIRAGSEVADALVQVGLAASKTEARRFIADNAVALNGQKTQKTHFDAGDFANGRLFLRRGRAFKDTALVEST